MAQVAAQFDPVITSLSASLDAMIQRGVPGDDDDVVKLHQQRDTLITKRAETIAMFEKALDDINQKQNDAIEKLVNQLGEYPVGAH